MTSDLHLHSAAAIQSKARPRDIAVLSLAALLFVQLIFVILRLSNVILWEPKFVFAPVIGAFLLGGAATLMFVVVVIVVGLVAGFAIEVAGSFKRIFGK